MEITVTNTKQKHFSDFSGTFISPHLELDLSSNKLPYKNFTVLSSKDWPDMNGYLQNMWQMKIAQLSGDNVMTNYPLLQL